jgi:hypothetical protein
MAGGMYNDKRISRENEMHLIRHTAIRGEMHNQQHPTVTNCNLLGNTADLAGGMYNDHSSPTVTNCTFSGNTVTTAAADAQRRRAARL